MDVFTVKVHESYSTHERPNSVRHYLAAQVTVPSVTAAEAPVVAGVEGSGREVRSFRGRQFARYLPWGDPSQGFRRPTETVPGDWSFLSDVDTGFEVPLGLHGAAGLEEYAQGAQACYDRFLIVDGVVWIEGESPVFEPFWFSGAEMQAS